MLIKTLQIVQQLILDKNSQNFPKLVATGAFWPLKRSKWPHLSNDILKMGKNAMEVIETIYKHKPLGNARKHGLLKYPDCQLQNTVKLAEAEKCIIA